MKYMALIYEDPAGAPPAGSPDWGPLMQRYMALAQALQAEGKWIAGEGLAGPETATTLRRRGGQLETMDGPFAETREHLGGFYLFEAADLDEALAWAAQIPSVDWGSIELRPVMEY
ncbi:YciI family protein [Xinfangfangia pollutisoli]|uniref:YciI family protein n=1 Tax=Xinfangfangia pollutisoli TaxID=2865960 RepID=UPI001CD58FDF|nr:YciI family protein [Xinfangfangia pollutisoli]